MKEYKMSPNAGFSSSLCSAAIYSVFAYFFYKYAFQVETTTKCFANSEGQNIVKDAELQKNAYDVSANFQSLLELYCYSIIADIIREILAAMWYKTKADFLLSLRKFLSLAHIVQFVAFIMLHVYRLRNAGKVCSADFVPEDAANRETLLKEDYLDERGHFMWVLLMIYWISMGVLCGCLCIAIIGFAVLAAKA